MPLPGNRIFARLRRPDDRIVAAFRGHAVSNIADTMGRMFCADGDIKPASPNMRLAGPALTVKVRPGDNLFLHKALDMAEAGDIIVVDAQGDTTNSLLGEIMVRYAAKRGIGGIVVDGSIRDSDGVVQSKTVPVFARGYSAMGPYKDGPGEINTVVSCGGVVVHPGDIVVGDSDGVVFVPAVDAEHILAATNAIAAAEQRIFAAIEAGTYERSWVDAKLAQLKTEIIDGYCES